MKKKIPFVYLLSQDTEGARTMPTIRSTAISSIYNIKAASGIDRSYKTIKRRDIAELINKYKSSEEMFSLGFPSECEI